MSLRPPRIRATLTAAVLAPLALGPAVLGPVPAAQASAPDDDEVAFTVADPRITEQSGLGVSRRHDGIVYTHNDSGGVPRIFALGPDGRTRATLTVAGVEARDWEGMAMGRDDRGRPALFIGDIGDNMGGAWPYITVYRVTEPRTLRDRTVRATRFRLKYADGARNAETLMVHPKTNRLYIASKLLSGKLYAAPRKLDDSGFNTLREVGDAPTMATGGSFAPDGRSFVIRTYFGARIYAMSGGKPGKRIDSVNLPGQEQGESVTHTADGTALLVGSEGAKQPVYRVPLPDDLLPSPSPSNASAGSDTGDTADGRRDSTASGVALVIAVGVAAAIGYGLVRRRS